MNSRRRGSIAGLDDHDGAVGNEHRPELMNAAEGAATHVEHSRGGSRAARGSSRATGAPILDAPMVRVPESKGKESARPAATGFAASGGDPCGEDEGGSDTAAERLLYTSRARQWVDIPCPLSLQAAGGVHDASQSADGAWMICESCNVSAPTEDFLTLQVPPRFKAPSRVWHGRVPQDQARLWADLEGAAGVAVLTALTFYAFRNRGPFGLGGDGDASLKQLVLYSGASRNVIRRVLARAVAAGLVTIRSRLGFRMEFTLPPPGTLPCVSIIRRRRMPAFRLPPRAKVQATRPQLGYPPIHPVDTSNVENNGSYSSRDKLLVGRLAKAGGGAKSPGELSPLKTATAEGEEAA